MLARKRPRSLGKHHAKDTGEGSGLGFLHLTNPKSDQFAADKIGDPPNELAHYMLAVQVRRYGAEEVDARILPLRTLISHMKLLLKEFTLEQIKRGIRHAADTSLYPFSIIYIRKTIKGLQDEGIC
jgi:hypothetical protein